MDGLSEPQEFAWDTDNREDASSTTSVTETVLQDDLVKQQDDTLSPFESIFTTYPPILESLLAQIPTASVLDLYHTSRHWRDFLRTYPLAWTTLSFRLPQPAAVVGTPGNETPDGRDRQSKAYSFDALLKQIIQPFGTRLTSLDLCNTAASGHGLSVYVLLPRAGTLQHLSVRGCKNISIKYHLVPFLEPYTQKNSPWSRKDLALKSIYTYRCRHHRRRPYLPSSLVRRDSDSDPTHQLIEICHQLGIWTDTAWCPTPGGRCFRRKDYHAGRAGPQNMEVWVPFDRLWRSSNRIGSTSGEGKIGSTDGRLWEIAETGQDGEPLGTENGQCKGEGKSVPAHDRKSHKTFVEDVNCAQCNEVILERCESCSVRMHCMGCRKTLCASCAFNRPIPRKKAKTRHFAHLAFGPGNTLGSTMAHAAGSSATLEEQNRLAKSEFSDKFWWAPGATRSPNLMNESVNDDDSSDSEDGANLHNGLPMPPLHREPPKLNMQWCCLEPIFSGGGGIAVIGAGLGGRGSDKLRASPLPRTKEFEDPDFSNQLRTVDYIRELKNNGLYEYVLGEDVDLLSYLKRDSLDLQAETCPRGLCSDCYRSFRWKIACRTCKNPLCKEHDFRGLKIRKCGFRDMHIEREYVRTHNETPRLVIPEFNPRKSSGKAPEQILDGISSPSRTSLVSTLAETEPAESSSMSQSQILLSLPTSSTMDLSASPAQRSNTPTADPFSGTSSLPFIPVSSSRPRSFSASGVRNRNSVSWANSPRAPVNSISNPLPLPCNPRHPVQWEGCGAYFCQSSRPVGDNRAPCPAVLKDCTECGVLVCDTCALNNPLCTCTYCTVHFHCAFCARKSEVKAQCRFEEEQKEKALAEQRAVERLEKELEDRGKADSVAGQAYEFWTLMGEVMDELNDYNDDEQDPILELPVPSPDSITVTTEFGVHEEPNNVTTIMAAGPPVLPEYAIVDEEEGVLNAIPLATPTASSQVFITPPIMNLDNEPQAGELTEDMADDEGEDAIFDDEDIDAESALIDEFIDDGLLIPNTNPPPFTNHTQQPSSS